MICPYDLATGREWICVIALGLGNDAKRDRRFKVSFRCSSECDRQTATRAARDCLSEKDRRSEKDRSPATYRGSLR